MIEIEDQGDAEIAPLIDGELQPSIETRRLQLVNPATAAPTASMSIGAPGDVDRAVEAARAAFRDGRWHKSPPSIRKAVLHRFADLIDRDATTLDRIDAVDMGKPIGLATGSARSAASLMRFYAEAVDKCPGEAHDSSAGSLAVQIQAPFGVVGAVTPWNFPTMNALRKLAPALAAGNCVVHKPSELAPRAALRLATLAAEAGVPRGVLNVVPGLGSTVGTALAHHSDVDLITFTGSTHVGKIIAESAGRSNMKAVIAECGGKSPHIIFDDGVDLDAACAFIARQILTNQGQLCSVGSRVLVQRSIEPRVTERLTELMGKIAIGDPLDRTTTFGPLASQQQFERVQGFVERAEARGIVRVLGGAGLAERPGFYFAPTLFRNVPPDAEIAQQEIFGPVLSLIAFGSEEEAIAIANGTVYGLISYVWSARIDTGLRVAAGLRSSVILNAAPPEGEGAGHAMAFEPAGQSGLRPEGGIAGMAAYLRRKSLWINYPATAA
nr:aldehyde dehydrogenase family protein [Sphingomonas sp. Y57]